MYVLIIILLAVNGHEIKAMGGGGGPGNQKNSLNTPLLYHLLTVYNNVIYLSQCEESKMTK